MARKLARTVLTNPALALVMLVIFTAVAWTSIKVLRRLQTGTAA